MTVEEKKLALIAKGWKPVMEDAIEMWQHPEDPTNDDPIMFDNAWWQYRRERFFERHQETK